ncbi:hypothetical protein [Streptomyces kaempferi]|uniref:Uncharacterized protein n=1 Tax=Streptomyces kaempferi TaxID=333725 RepID=A0ABW3XNW5_9ACTN
MAGYSEDHPSIIKIMPLQVGAVRLACALAPEESTHGALTRDLSPQLARRLAIELLQAAEEAELNDARYGR